MQEVNSMIYQSAPVPKKKKGKSIWKIIIEQANADPSEDECTYSIEYLNICEPANKWESDSVWLLTQCKEVQTANKK